MDQLQILTKKVEHLARAVEAMSKATKKETWVKVGYITSHTIWDNREKLREARNQGLVKCRKTEQHGIQYLLESINDRFFKPNY